MVDSNGRKSSIQILCRRMLCSFRCQVSLSRPQGLSLVVALAGTLNSVCFLRVCHFVLWLVSDIVSVDFKSGVGHATGLPLFSAKSWLVGIISVRRIKAFGSGNQ